MAYRGQCATKIEKTCWKKCFPMFMLPVNRSLSDYCDFECHRGSEVLIT